MKLFLKGERCYTDKCGYERRAYPPGQHGQNRRRKRSDYGEQLREKQKVKRIYGLAEKQFRGYYHKALRMPGVTGNTLIQLLERRLDNVVYRMGFASDHSEARQLVRHGHFHVNGRRVNIPSFHVRPNDLVNIRPNSSAEAVIRDATDLTSSVASWLLADHDNLTGKVLRLPERVEIDTPVQEQLIVELYSK